MCDNEGYAWGCGADEELDWREGVMVRHSNGGEHGGEDTWED
jgi:hypothetical protein